MCACAVTLATGSPEASQQLGGGVLIPTLRSENWASQVGLISLAATKCFSRDQAQVCGILQPTQALSFLSPKCPPPTCRSFWKELQMCREAAGKGGA